MASSMDKFLMEWKEKAKREIVKQSKNEAVDVARLSRHLEGAAEAKHLKVQTQPPRLRAYCNYQVSCITMIP
jgi:hypothetical protein